MIRKMRILALMLSAALFLPACGRDRAPAETAGAAEGQTEEAVREAEGPEGPAGESDAEETIEAEPAGEPEESGGKEEESSMKLFIDGQEVTVSWENNDAVRALEELTADSPLTADLSMYGGFEQVGPLGTSLPRDDRQTTTGSGDIVLYSGDQIVIFYGSNSWSYTRLGHITDRSGEEMEALLGRGDVSIEIAP